MKTEVVKGHPIKCYDSGGSGDRYTIVFLDQPECRPRLFAAIGCSAFPFHPQGVGQHCCAAVGKHLGKRVLLASLPKDVQTFVHQDLDAYKGEYK